MVSGPSTTFVNALFSLTLPGQGWSRRHRRRKRARLKLVSRKSTKKILGIGKWKKLDSGEKTEPGTKNGDSPRSVVGLPLTSAVELNPSFDGIPLPAFFRQALDFVEGRGLKQEGIYRICSPKTRLDDLEANAGKEGIELTFFDAHEAAGLIKRFLRQLPHSLLDPEIEQVVAKCACSFLEPCCCPALTATKEQLARMEKPHFYMLAYVFLHARNVIAMEPNNKMSLQALGILLHAVLDLTQKMICYLINNPTLFTGISIEPYTPPRNCTTIEQWKCEDKPLIEKELKKQNNLLNYLHQQISGSLPDQDVSAVEERLWQVQTAITALKRRLKAVAEPTTAQAPGEMEEKPCVEMYEEKQLMAVQASLRNDISDEKKRIALLLYKMEIFEKEHGEPETFTVEIQESGQEEETKRKALISELDQLRTECALIRAKIEMATQSAMISTRF